MLRRFAAVLRRDRELSEVTTAMESRMPTYASQLFMTFYEVFLPRCSQALGRADCQVVSVTDPRCVRQSTESSQPSHSRQLLHHARNRRIRTRAHHLGVPEPGLGQRCAKQRQAQI